MAPRSITASPSCNPQFASRLFHIPIEIRFEIYVHIIHTTGVHVTLSDHKGIRLSPCCGCDLDAEHTGMERQATTTAYELWLRRLSSSWGPHWECEEIALIKGVGGGEPEDAWRRTAASLRVCQLMRSEVVELMTRHVRFHVTDLETLDALLEISGTSTVENLRIFGFKDSILPYITQLDITLRLALPVFQALEGVVTTIDGASSAASEEYVRIWSGLPAKVFELQELCKLRIWLDHADVTYWSVVNECAVLGQFARLPTPQQLDLVFYLAYLHPQLEDPARHFIEGYNYAQDSALPPFKIRRLLRQRYCSETDCNGRYYMRYRRDFPILYGALWSDMSLTQMEEYERRLWRAGIDVQKILAVARHHCS